MSDLIDRQATIDEIKTIYEWHDTVTMERLVEHINNLPSRQPEPSTNCSEFPNNSDTVSRQATIDAAKDWYEGLICGSVNGLIKRLNALPTIQPEPQWIPVERKLPEDFTDVLVWFEYFRYGDYNCLYQTHGIGAYVANYNLWTVNHETGWKDLRVIAWMPLPEAYKPNE